MKRKIFGLAAMLALPSCGATTPEGLCSGEATRSRMEEYVHTTRLIPDRAQHQDIVKDVELELRDPAVYSYDENTRMAVCTATVSLTAPDGYVLRDEHDADVPSWGERQSYRVQPAANGSGLLIDWRYYDSSSLMGNLASISTREENEARRRARATAAAEVRRKEAENRARHEADRLRREKEARQAQAISRERFMKEVNEARAQYQTRSNPSETQDCIQRQRQAYDAAGGGVAGSQAVRAMPHCR